MNSYRLERLLPALLGAVALVLLTFWLWPRTPSLVSRIPGTDQSPGASAGGTGGNPVLRGQLRAGTGKRATNQESFIQFRGNQRDGLASSATPLARSWNASQPRQLWSIPVGEGYAGPIVFEGGVYLMDYDRDTQSDALRCLSLEDGREIWRFSYPVKIKRNHGMSRTIPAIHSNRVVAIGPKCHVLCLDARTGELKWGLDMVREFGTTVPPWYTGQCPLIEGDLVILAPAGPNALLAAVSLDTGEVVWTSPNPRGWKMTHASVMAGELAGHRTFVYCGSGGVAGIAMDGTPLWDTTEWKISIATVPSPVILSPDRVFLTGGYGAGALMLEVLNQEARFSTRTRFRLPEKAFGATQHTPILFQGHFYGVHPDGQFVCLDLEGNTRWTSGRNHRFGLGPFLIANDMIFTLNDSGMLSLMSAIPDQFQLLGQAKVLNGRDSWGPLALAGNRLLVRDLENLACLEVGE
jgi:outer membrane protein assembly factor BamB